MAGRSTDGIITHQLANGLTVVAEPLSEFSSVSIGIWVLTGSRDESESQSGISHLIEHLVFKGTPTRSARQIALEIDSLGGTLNAFTGKEFTSYYARVLGDALPQAMEILGDITLHSLFAADELEREKDVVVQEISMVEDTPDDLVHDVHCREFWSDNSLGWPILGTRDSLAAMDPGTIKGYHSDRYRAGNTVITASGNLDVDFLLEQINSRFADLAPGSALSGRNRPASTPGVHVINRPMEQVHYCAGFQGLPADDDRRYAMFLLNTILGGGMSSRLFQKIREEQGLAYSVYSYSSAYQDTGLHTIYCGTSPEGFPTTMKIIREELADLASTSVSENELATACRQLKGNLLLGLESTGNRMNQLARNQIYFGRQITPENIAAAIDNVTGEMIRGLAEDLFDLDNLAVTAIGPLSEEEVVAAVR
jgi:predicted Zn-dependent peptidase